MAHDDKRQDPPLLICNDCKRPMDYLAALPGDCRPSRHPCLQVRALPESSFDCTEMTRTDANAWFPSGHRPLTSFSSFFDQRAILSLLSAVPIVLKVVTIWVALVSMKNLSELLAQFCRTVEVGSAGELVFTWIV